MIRWDEYIAKHGLPSRGQAMSFIEDEHAFADEAARYLLDHEPSLIELERIVVASETFQEEAWLRLRQVVNKGILKRIIRKIGILSDEPPAIVLDAWYLVLEQEPSVDDLMDILEDAKSLEAMAIHEMMRRQVDWATIDKVILPTWFDSFIEKRRIWQAANSKESQTSGLCKGLSRNLGTRDWTPSQGAVCDEGTRT